LQAPANTDFAVTVNGAPVGVQSGRVGFKRRPLYAPHGSFDFRIENSLYLQLVSPIPDNATVEVKSAAWWPASLQFITVKDPFRYSSAIHVNQEGYARFLDKK